MEKCNIITYNIFIVSILILFSSFFSLGQFYQTTTARSLSLGGCGLLLNDVGSFYSNPAILTTQNQLSTSCNYENDFFISMLQKSALVVGLPLTKGAVGLGIRTSGIQNFRSIESTIGYGLQLNENFSIGTSLGIYNTSIQGYGSKFGMNFDLGIYGNLSEKIKYGCSIHHLGNSNVSALNPVGNPSSLHVGMQYIVSNSISIYSEIEKKVGYPIRVKIASEYLLIKSFTLRLGIASAGYTVSAGLGYIFHTKLRMDFGSTWQPILGTSIHTGLVYTFKDSKQHE